MKKFSCVIVVLILFSCESKETITQKIDLLKVHIVKLQNNTDVLYYEDLIKSAKKTEIEILELNMKLDNAIKNSENETVVYLETIIEGAKKRLDEHKDRIDYFKTKNDKIQDSIVSLKDEIIILEKKLE